MDKRKILGTGLQGLIGSRIVDLLTPTYSFENISRTTGVDITNGSAVAAAIERSDASVIIHLAAKANVDACEKDKDQGEDGEAWKINVLGTENVANACSRFGKKMIYISTDFVFDGEKEFYQEQDHPNPLNWYAQTKYEGEKIVQRLQTPWIISRIAYPYRGVFPKKDFVRAIKGKLENGESVSMVTNHIMTPTFIDDIADAFRILLEKNVQGIFHVVGSQFISPYETAIAIAEIFGYDKESIGKTTRENFFANGAVRPFRLALKNDKIGSLGAKMSTFLQGLEKIKDQI